MDEVKKTFDQIAGRYDSERRKLIPGFDEFYRVVVEMVPFDPQGSWRFLDLGAGTGLLTQFLRARFSEAEYALMDFSPEMLAQARARFAGQAGVQFLEADYATADWPGTFDGVFSSLSIHHLSDEVKQTLYRKVLGHLKPGGVFLNAEFVRAESSELQARYWQLWIESMKAAGLSEPEVGHALERTSIDILTPVEVQLEWLKEAGFAEVGCHYRRYLFAVFGGRRP
ncbi:MAG TPA: methyltransferase domain-containing protein [bacterium]|nr:methyltransferase domain-containing protein [bacterium]